MPRDCVWIPRYGSLAMGYRTGKEAEMEAEFCKMVVVVGIPWVTLSRHPLVTSCPCPPHGNVRATVCLCCWAGSIFYISISVHTDSSEPTSAHGTGHVVFCEVALWKWVFWLNDLFEPTIGPLFLLTWGALTLPPPPHTQAGMESGTHPNLFSH